MKYLSTLTNRYISFISTNGVKLTSQAAANATPNHSHCVNPTRPPSTQRINYAEMNLTHKFLL